MEERAEGAVDQRRRLVQLELAHVAVPQLELDARGVGARSGLGEHRLREVDADDSAAGGLRRGNRDPSGPDGELDDRAVGLADELRVPGDVLGHVGRPAVVDRREDVVFRRGQEGDDTVAAVDAPALQTEAQSAIAAAGSLDELEAARIRYLGRKSELKLALREVRDRETGMALNDARVAIEEALEAKERELAAAAVVPDTDFDVTLPGEAPPQGSLHPVTQIRRAVEDAFLGLGYEVRDDREVETVEFNFDKLAFPAWHHARSPRQTFFFDENRVLRTETSASQIHIMEEREPPIYMVSIGRVYRRDTIDATHFTIFHQFEGLAVDKGLTLADLKGTLLHVMRALYGPERAVRFRTHYFPFTEPSIEPDVSCPLCDGEGCRVCKHSGWLEMGGAGMVDPAVFENVGYDPEQWSGFAFGMGLERTAQLRHAIPGLRPLWENDLRVLRQF